MSAIRILQLPEWKMNKTSILISHRLFVVEPAISLSCCMSPFSSQWTTFLKMFLILWTLITRLRRRLSFSIRRIPLWPSVSSSSACVCPTIFCITWPLIFAWREKYGFLKMKGLYWSLLIFILLFRSIDSHRGPQLEVNPQQFHTGYIIY